MVLAVDSRHASPCDASTPSRSSLQSYLCQLRRTRLPRLLFLFSILVALLALESGCNEPHVALPIKDAVIPFSGPWEYRYGDSPRSATGRLRWAERNFEDGGWTKTKEPLTPNGHQGEKFLWLRTRLSGPVSSDPMLYARTVDDRYQAFLDGDPIGPSEELPPATRLRIGGATPLFLQLPAAALGRMLVLRIYSDNPTIGISPPWIYGGRTEVLVYIIKREISGLFVGLLIGAVSLVSFAVFLVWRKDKQTLFFGLFSLTAGIFIFLARNSSRYFINDSTALWWSIELSSLCLLNLFACRFFATIFGPGPLGLTRHFSNAYAAFYVISIILVMFFGISAMQMLPYLQLLMLPTVIYLAIYFTYVGIQGNIDARILAVGFITAALPIVYDLVVALGFLHGSFNSAPLSASLCVITLGVILVRRLRGLQRRLHDYSAMLQINMAASKQLDIAEQGQVALSQVHELLPLSASRLYLFQPDSKQLDLVAGRAADGTVVTSTHPDEQVLLKTALRRGKPTWGRRRHRRADSKKSRVVTAVAMLLQAQSQTLGGLYLELADGHEELADDEQELLDRLCDQLALSMLTARATHLAIESALAQRRLAEQGALLQAAVRMASGDLASPIQVSQNSQLASLAAALDSMRRDLQAKISTLEANNREIYELNDELRRQIDQRSRRVLELALRSEDKRLTRTSHYEPGSLIGEHYSVVRLLGQGAMGSVYEVQRTTDGRHLAAKVLTARADKTTMVRFAREAQLLSRLTHPNLISIIDVDVTQSGVLYLVMELVRGTTLKHCLDRFGDLGFVIPVLQQIAAGLAAIHASGIVHRDLKPANVLVAENKTGGVPFVKLVDFGISTLARTGAAEGASRAANTTPAASANLSGRPAAALPALSTDEHVVFGAPTAPPLEHITSAGIAIGTPMYMAPECMDRTLGAQPLADVFSFGVIAYELITGSLPFDRPAIVITARHEPLTIPALRALRADLPPEIAELLTRCLSAAADQRPSAAALAAALTSASSSQ